MGTVFSYILEINGKRYYSFGNLKTYESVDGFGMSGVCTQEFSFSISFKEYALYTIPSAAKVELYAGENYLIVSGFISSRSKRGNTVSFTCYDRMIYTDQLISFTENDFKDDKVEAIWLLEKIRSQCGFESWGFQNPDIPGISVSREKVEGRTGREILEMLSEAWCGVFRTPDNKYLSFLPFEEPTAVGDTDAGLNHASVTEENSKGPIEQVIMTNGSEEFQSGNTGADVFKTLKISSDLASQELASNIMKRVRGLTYQAWDCSKLTYESGLDIVFNNIVSLKTEIKFKDGIIRTTNHVEKNITAYGIFIACGSNDFTENEFEYLGALSRKIANKISDGEVMGNQTLITRYQGTIHLGETRSSVARAASEPQKRYGYAPATYEGVVKFDGAMVDKTLPEIVVKDDVSGFSTKYGDTVIDYDLVWDGDNVILKEKEAVQ